jgi:excisionase family DNA binding protein
VLIVDEAGMVGTRDIATLAGAAWRAQAKLVLVGDDRQLPEIDAGGAFRALAQRLGAIELREVHRQPEPWDRDALRALRGGDVESFAEAYHAHGRLVAAPTADAVRDTLAGDWWHAHDAGERALMIAHRRSDVADLNRRARELLRNAGRLGSYALGTDRRAFAISDRVVTTRNNASLAVVNGQTGTLTACHDGQLRVELDDGRRVDLPESYAHEGHLDHAYATTGHRAQGATVDRAFVLGSDELYRRVGLHRPLPPPPRSALLRHRGPRLPQPGPGSAARRRPPAPRRPAPQRKPRRTPRPGPSQRGPRHRTRPVTTQIIDDNPPRGLTRAELMTTREVAELLSVPISTVREWGRNGTLPRAKLGRHVRYIRRHVEAAILDAAQR